MSEFIWYWTQGNKKIFTLNIAHAEQALRDGYFVMGTRALPSEG